MAWRTAWLRLRTRRPLRAGTYGYDRNVLDVESYIFLKLLALLAHTMFALIAITLLAIGFVGPVFISLDGY